MADITAHLDEDVTQLISADRLEDRGSTGSPLRFFI
jgi:hypothetical protein